jgi:two-component system response regulator PilR (NtrC family)
MAPPLVLVVDDEPDLVELVTLTLARMQLATQSAGDVAGAKKLLKAQHFDLCLTDMRLPDGDGLDLLEWMALNCPGVPCAVITAHGNVESAVRALKLGAFDFVSKPLDLGVLRRIVSTALKLSQSPDSAMSTRTGTQLIGNAATMDRLREMILRVARSQAPVHIYGESGTGKELVARMIHASGPRADGPFVPVNCGAIPAELMESELFGHARGAFTGAHQQREGLFLAARGGTLFLDEISEMRGDLQVKLLRALEEGRIRPVGADREIPIDARIVASSQPGLLERVRQRQFREDLYFRLNVVHILLPSLRERPEDVGALAHHFMQQVADEFGVAPTAFDAAQLLRLSTRDWPGNVRELRNFIERTVVMGETPDDEYDESAATVAGVEESAYPLDWTLEQVKQAHIARVLAKNRGNRTAAARQLGVSRRTLERRLAPGAACDVED